MFHEQKRTYLDLYLDNNVAPRKRERYFEDREEQAIIKYNDPATEVKEKNLLFEKIIGPCFKKTVDGVLEMPKFRHLPKSMNRVSLIEDTFFRLVEKIYKFQAGMISKKSGMPVKAFSYFSTVAKNFILEQITKHNKVLKNKADVETSIDLSILSEDTLQNISNIESNEIHYDYVSIFAGTKKQIVEIIRELIIEEEAKEKRDEDFIRLGYCLKYVLEKWNKIEFMKKNEFMRILTLYSGMPQQKVSFLFKRFKTAVLKKIKPSALNKNKRKKEVEIDEDLYLEQNEIDESTELFEREEDIDIDLIFDEKEEDKPEDEESKIMSYDIYSLDEFEARDCKLDNAKLKKEWRRKQS